MVWRWETKFDRGGGESEINVVVVEENLTTVRQKFSDSSGIQTLQADITNPKLIWSDRADFPSLP